MRENITGDIAGAQEHLVNPRMVLGELDLHPKPVGCVGVAPDLSAFKTQSHWDTDFDGAPKSNRRVRGAYASPGVSGWRLQSGLKP